MFSQIHQLSPSARLRQTPGKEATESRPWPLLNGTWRLGCQRHPPNWLLSFCSPFSHPEVPTRHPIKQPKRDYLENGSPLSSENPCKQDKTRVAKKGTVAPQRLSWKTRVAWCVQEIRYLGEAWKIIGTNTLMRSCT